MERTPLAWAAHILTLSRRQTEDGIAPQCEDGISPLHSADGIAPLARQDGIAPHCRDDGIAALCREIVRLSCDLVLTPLKVPE